MLFITYWELNENMSTEERQEVAKRLTSSGTRAAREVDEAASD